MRLIDADKLKIRNVSADYWYTVMGITENDIDNAPTVKAIPIEWIEKWLKEQERIVLISPPYYNQVRVPKMLADWEKENETN